MKNYLMNPFEGRLHWPSISFDRLPRPGAAALTTLVALASAVVLLAGCASPGTPLRKLDETPAAAVGLSVAPATAAPARWWATLGDAQLATLVDKALRDQPSLAAAQARVQQALALAQVTEAADGPQADLSASATRQRYPEHGLYPAPIAGSILNSGSVNAGFGWSPDWYGRQAAALASSLDQARAAQADAALAANALATQVARSYVGLARHQLASLTAQAPDALDALAPSLAQINVQRLPATLGADLLGRRPEVVAARWRVEAASQDIKVARTAFYPDINLTAFVGLSAIGLDQLFEAGSHQYGVTPALHLPLFDGGRLRAQLHGRQAELNAAIAQYNANVLDAVREASDAIGSLQSLERQRREQADALAGAQTAHELALQRYRAGLGSYLIVLNTESQWLAQRRAAVDLQARQLDTGIALIKSLGGGWQGDPPAPAKVAAAH